nr:hypothetical protein [uncultured Steroidobacter sp.]
MITYNRSGLMISMLLVGALLSGPGLAEEPATATAAALATKTDAARKPLDLRAPSITQLYTREELDRIVAASYIREDIEEVQVESGRVRPPNTPNVWPGIAAPFWAVLNPAQSWRIFAPLPPDQTRDWTFASATDAYVLEPAGVPSPFAH